MKRWLAVFILALGTRCYAQVAALPIQQCVNNATQASLSGMQSTNYLVGDIPSCTVTIYLTRTSTLATYYLTPGGSPQTGPFTASPQGQFLVYVTRNQGYDVVLSGGVAPNVYQSPVTFTGLFSGGGGGVTGTCDVIVAGAIGDCATDDTAAIQACFPQSGTVKQNVYFPPAPGGCYKITGTITEIADLTGSVTGSGPSSQIQLTTPNVDAFDWKCISGPCEDSSTLWSNMTLIYAGSTTTSGAGLHLTGNAPTLTQSWNGDNFAASHITITGFTHDFQDDSVANLDVDDFVLKATATHSAAQPITAGSCSGGGAGQCTITATNATGYTTNSTFYITGANPNVLDSPFGILSVAYFTSGTVTGTIGQTCTTDTFINPIISGAVLTITLTQNLSGQPLAQGNNTAVVTNPGIVTAGVSPSSTLHSGTATCSGTAHSADLLVGALPFTATNVSGNVITYTNAQVSGSTTLSTGGNFEPIMHQTTPGSLAFFTGNVLNDIYAHKFSLNCGQGHGSYVIAGIEDTGTGQGQRFSVGDTNACDYVFLGQNGQGVTLDIGDVEQNQGPIVYASQGNVLVEGSNLTATTYPSLSSPIVSNNAQMVINSPSFPLNSQTAPTVACNPYCYKVILNGGVQNGAAGKESTYGITGALQFPWQPMNFGSGGPPVSTNYARGSVFLGLDDTNTQQDLIFFKHNVNNVSTVDYLAFGSQVSPIYSLPYFVNTGSTAQTLVGSVTIPPGLMTANSIVAIDMEAVAGSGNSGTCTYVIKGNTTNSGGAAILGSASGNGTTLAMGVDGKFVGSMANVGSVSSQVAVQTITTNAAPTLAVVAQPAPVTAAINTGGINTTYLNVYVTNSVSGDSCEGWVTVNPKF